MTPPKKRNVPIRLRLLGKLYRLRTLHSPLQLRNSLRRLHHYYDRPWLALLRLFNPFPAWYFPLPDPIPASDMLGNEALMLSRWDEETRFTSIPIWRARDTSLRSLYRLYESMASGEYAPIGRETEYFWYQPSWVLQKIPDPRDPDPVRYAIIACLVEEMVAAFNWRLSLGLRRNKKHILREQNRDPWPPYTPVSGPIWTRHVPPIERSSLVGLPQRFVNTRGQLVLEKGGKGLVFAARNIVTNVGWLYTV